MYRHAFNIFCSLAIALIIMCGINTTNAEQILKHPGWVVDMITDQPVSVDVKAWPESSKTGDEGGCPLYGKSPLDSTISDIKKNGSFELQVAASKPTYTATYCAAGYVPRADRDRRNQDDGSTVQPIPVKVLKRDTDKKTYKILIERKTADILNDLAYLQSSNPKMYEEVMVTLAKNVAKFSTRHAEMLYTFKNIIQNWNL